MAGGYSGRNASGMSKARSKRSRSRPVCFLTSAMWKLGKSIPPSAWFGWGSGRKPRGKRSFARTSSGSSDASFSHVNPAGSRARAPAWTGLPRDMATPGAGRSERSYRSSSLALAPAINWAFASVIFLLVSANASGDSPRVTSGAVAQATTTAAAGSRRVSLDLGRRFVGSNRSSWSACVGKRRCRSPSCIRLLLKRGTVQ